MPQSPTPRAPSGALFHLLHRAGQCADELFAAGTAAGDLTPRQYTVLAAAAGIDEPSQTDLVDRTGIDRSTIADIVRRLVERKLVERRRTRHDARMYAIRLTAAGKTALALSKPAADLADAKLTAMLSKDQRTALTLALQQIVDTLGPISSAGGGHRSETSEPAPFGTLSPTVD